MGHESRKERIAYRVQSVVADVRDGRRRRWRWWGRRRTGSNGAATIATARGEKCADDDREDSTADTRARELRIDEHSATPGYEIGRIVRDSRSLGIPATSYASYLVIAIPG